MAIGITAVVLLVVARLWLMFDRVTLLPVTLDRPSVLLGLAVGGGITLASALIYEVWPAYRRSADNYLAMVLQPLHWPDLLWMGLLPGMSEELLFRGVMLPAIGLTWIGVLVSGLSFGVLHLSNLRQWPYMVWAALIGLLLAATAAMTGNLLVPIVAHILTNWVSSVVWKLRLHHATPKS